MGNLSKEKIICELYSYSRYLPRFLNKKPLLKETIDSLLNLDENSVNNTTISLCELLHNDKLEKRLQKILYRAALLIGQEFPRNQVSDEGQVLDPISLSPVVIEDLFYSLDRYHWSIRSLVEYLHTQSEYRNPVTRVIFTPKDVILPGKIGHLAKQLF